MILFHHVVPLFIPPLTYPLNVHTQTSIKRRAQCDLVDNQTIRRGVYHADAIDAYLRSFS